MTAKNALSAKFVLMLWLLAMVAALILPETRTLPDGRILVRVCSLKNGVSYIALAGDAQLSGQISDSQSASLIQDSCKCGLSSGQLTLIASMVASDIQSQPIPASSPELSYGLFGPLVPFISSRAPPSLT